jgi:diacylglycerol kinase (ATP)
LYQNFFDGSTMFSPQRIWNAFTFTRQGLKSAWQTEAAFRDNVLMVFGAQLLCLWLQPVTWLWLMLLFANALLLAVELLNTGIEYVVDHISLDKHDLLGRAKDVGSAAVFMMLCMNALLLIMIGYQAWGR